ncbi:unnamed protein product [Larinioides sclopetarius]|uniref:Aldehyde dehydrogenase domain-containing protein n=1 Tax=Larinioides sclopetarius TaxID=280406 RepID=A0AAV1YU67_9ARAC
MSDIIVIKNFINGEFVESRKFLDSFNPATGEVLARVPDSDALDVEQAVRAAKNAFPEWSNKEPAVRSKLLHRLADLLESRLLEFATAESRDQGKPLWLAHKIEIPRAVLNIRHFANTILCDKEICINQPEDGILNYTSRSPCGVAGTIVPWNLPLYLLTFKLGPALAYGNTVVAKPSEFTSVTAWMLCSLIKEAGIPDGVVNMVFGYGPRAGEALIRHPDIALITFTGSDRAGLHIAEVAGSMAKKVSLELFNLTNSEFFLGELKKFLLISLYRGSFINQGQICLSTSRIYVERKLFSTFAERFVAEAK